MDFKLETKFSSDTKKLIKEAQEKQFINNSYHIIKEFDRLNELETGVEDRIHFFERIFLKYVWS
ncbi:hypothetical protein CJ195_00310 [Bacillus sp. UMB0899]|nr:hypothetical protein CJ195_00310 [Bacillus sp. UMB0899]